jgi:hypothetical protein
MGITGLHIVLALPYPLTSVFLPGSNQLSFLEHFVVKPHHIINLPEI